MNASLRVCAQAAVLGWLAAAVAAQVVEYHDLSATSHQSQFTSLSGQGYRLTQLSVAGSISAPRYSAIWEQIGGPAWIASHNMTQSQYLANRTTWISQGYRAKLVTASGTGANTVFAAMFVADGASVVDVSASTESSFISTCNAQRGAGRILTNVDIYNDSGSPSYVAVFEPNSNDTVWGYVIDANHTAFTETFNAFYEAEARIAALGMTDDQRYVSVWRDDRLGAWAARSNYTPSGFATQVTTLTNAGYSPLVLASGGSGATLRIAGAFAQERTPRARVMTKTGQARPEFSAVDTYMTNHVLSTDTRTAVIAIAKDGRLVYTRGYTWAEAGTPIAQPTSLCRIASLAKVTTAMAVQKLAAETSLSLSDRPATLLNVVGGTTNFGNVTLLQCLEYTSGLVRNLDNWDAAELANPFNPVVPITPTQAVNWIAQHASLFAPGAYGNYCNTSFLLAGRVVEQQTGQSLQTWSQNNLYAPLGITRWRIAAGLPGNLAPGELRGYTKDLKLETSDVYTPARRKAQQWAKDLTLSIASGGAATSAVDYVRLLSGVFGLGADWITHAPSVQSSMLARHTVTGMPGSLDALDHVTPGAFSWSQRPNGVWAYNKGGTLDDASAIANWRSDGVAFAVFVNKGFAHADAGTLNGLIDAMPAWPNDDLFPTYGLPSFPRRPALTSVTPAVMQNVTNTPFVVTGERLDTVTAVHIGPHVILNNTPANWHLGWFHALSPTQLEVYLPQGVPPTTTGISVSNPNGTSSGVFVQISNTVINVAVSAPPTVTPTQSFRVYCGSGPLPALSFGVLTVSTSSLPSLAPGLISLGLGNQFSDLLVTDFQLFDPSTRTVWWQIPPLPWPSIYVQTAAIDFGAASPLPMPTSVVRQVVRS